MLSTRLLLIAFASLAFCDKLDYYELLGIKKTATNQEIRIAFKKLALTLHPDKNRDDPEASAKFIKVTRAYEVLKDAEKRKQYDLTGEDNDKARPEYHSYTYYRDHFGIYDDDEHIVTLSHVDFEAEVEGTDTQWFINFYSPMCHHCHKLAPAWRSLASKFNGAIYFGAVNCEETWSLCRQINIHQYPSLVFFPDDERLVGMKSQEELETFIMTKLKSDMVHIKSESTWDSHKETKPNWLLMLSSSTHFPKDYNIIASMLKGLIGVAVIYCEWMPCEDWGQNEGFLYMTKTGLDIWAYSPITGTAPRDVVDEVLRLLPGLQKIDEAKFQKLTRQLEQGSEQPWLIFFHMGAETNVDIETKKLKALLPDFNLGSINCGKHVNICQDLSIARYPQFVVFKAGGGREFHHGKETAQSVAAFAIEAASATNFRSINEKEFFSGIQDGGPFFVDFYTPWCPPCLRLLPQLRKASLSFTPEQVSFAVVDCTVHRELCAHQGVRAYPTTVLFNSTRKPQTFKGQTASSIVEFIQDVVHSHVIELNSENFYDTIAKKKIGTIWMVGFFMPWCQPCQQLSPHWRRLAKMVSDIPSIKIGEVNCEEETILCQEQGVRSYPHIRLYPHDSEDLSKVVIFSSYHRDAESLRRWLFNFVPSPITELTPEDFFQITSEDDIWLIDFYAPWCGHCVSFDPDFKTIAKKLEGIVKCGKLNCQDYPDGCRRAGVSGYPTVKLYGPQFKQGIEIHSQHQSVIIESVQNLLSRKTRFIDEL